MSLNAAEISGTDPEKQMQEMLNELLSSYFNGNQHTTPAGATEMFPLCTIAFNQTEIGTLSIPMLHWTFTNVQNSERSEGPDQAGRHTFRITSNVTSIVFAQASAGGEGNAADFACRRVAACLARLLNGGYAALLAEKGMYNARVRSGPVPVSHAGYQTRMMTVTCRLEYVVTR